MLTGNDISSFQSNIDWDTYKKNSNFVISKASEGTGFEDQGFRTNQTKARSVGLLTGFYHFCRPDLGNSAFDEANWFLKVVGQLQEGEILALDFEVIYSDCVQWCLAFLKEVEKQTRIKPLIYLNQSTCQNFDWQPVIDNGNALWIANYTGDPNNNTFQGGKWQTAAIEQWTDTQTVPGISGHLDGDAFYGDQTAFKAYGFTPIPPPDPCLLYKQQIETISKKYQQESKLYSDLSLEFELYKKDHPVNFSSPNGQASSVDPDPVIPPAVPQARSAFEQIVDSLALWWQNRK